MGGGEAADAGGAGAGAGPQAAAETDKQVCCQIKKKCRIDPARQLKWIWNEFLMI